MLRREITVVNKLGLHARAAAKFVKVASGFESEIQVTRDGRTVNGKSIMGVMMLAAGKGTNIELVVEGADEQHAMDELVKLMENRFGEPE